ncbi:hypothetical protein D3C78_1036050 [compost metagenome]
MAAMLGWDNAKENILKIRSCMKLDGKNGLTFSDDAIGSLERWLDFRQRIYTMIIAHPECIPYNALQTDLVRLAVANEIITPKHWFKTEPEFEEDLRNHKATEGLAKQLIAGCDYQFIDYVWFKNFSASNKRKNAEISELMESKIEVPFNDAGYFVWNERGLVSRAIEISTHSNQRIKLGQDSTSCMVALIKKTTGKVKPTKLEISSWRKEVTALFCDFLGVDTFEADFPETYRGSFYPVTEELKLELN